MPTVNRRERVLIGLALGAMIIVALYLYVVEPLLERYRELAVLTDPGSEEELVAALRFIVCEPQWRAVLGRNARAVVLSRYTWKHHVDSFLSRLEPHRSG